MPTTLTCVWVSDGTADVFSSGETTTRICVTGSTRCRRLYEKEEITSLLLLKFDARPPSALQVTSYAMDMPP